MACLLTTKKGCSTGPTPHCKCRFLCSDAIKRDEIIFNSCISAFTFHRDKIERATLTGENRQVILIGVQYPFAMTVFQQDIYWTDWTERAVFRAGKNDGSGVTALAQDLQYRPNDIHVYAASKQENCSNSCQQFNGGCSHVCVPGKIRFFLLIFFFHYIFQVTKTIHK